MPFFLLTSATAYLAPSTSLCARADKVPVNGSTMPILIGVSPRALMMNGDASCIAPRAVVALIRVRRLTAGSSRYTMGFLSGPDACVCCASDVPIDTLRQEALCTPRDRGFLHGFARTSRALRHTAGVYLRPGLQISFRR